MRKRKAIMAKWRLRYTVVGADGVVGDPDGKRFMGELEAQLQASTIYERGEAFDIDRLSRKAIRIRAVSVEVKGRAGETLGSVIVLSTAKLCVKDKDAERSDRHQVMVREVE